MRVQPSSLKKTMKIPCRHQSMGGRPFTVLLLVPISSGLSVLRLWATEINSLPGILSTSLWRHMNMTTVPNMRPSHIPGQERMETAPCKFSRSLSIAFHCIHINRYLTVGKDSSSLCWAILGHIILNEQLLGDASILAPVARYKDGLDRRCLH